MPPIGAEFAGDAEVGIAISRNKMSHGSRIASEYSVRRPFEERHYVLEDERTRRKTLGG
jgi:hypothetical protein